MVSIYELKLGAEKLEILKALSAEIEKAIASIGKIDNSRLNAIYNDILEKANQVLQDKNLVQELKDKVDVAHKDISEKAATISQKFEQQQALQQSLQELKAEIEALLKSGLIDDSTERTTTTYSSKKIRELLKSKTDKADFDDLKNTVGGKLGKSETAADSAKLGGLAADKYALKTEASDGLKIGSYLLWSSDRTTPAGFLPADGRRLQKSEYIELFDVIGYTYGGSGENFNLPKFNDGKFIRSTGGNAASLGISQGDAIRNIKGGFGDVSGVYGEFHNPTGAFTNNQPRKKYNGGGWTEDNTGLGFDASRAVPVANENRPYNMSVIILIKAKNVFEVTNIDKSPYATETKAGIVKLKNSITGSLSDTAVSENAAKEYTDVAKAQISSQLLGISQTLQDVTAQRQIGVTYTNKTGRPIYLTIMCLAWTDYTIKIGDVSISFGGGDQGRTSKQTYYGIVPNDVEYSLTQGSSFYWWELR